MNPYDLDKITNGVDILWMSYEEREERDDLPLSCCCYGGSGDAC